VKSLKQLSGCIHGWLPKTPSNPVASDLPSTADLTPKRTFLPVAGGILTIIGSFAVFFMGLFEVMPFAISIASYLVGNNFRGSYVFELLPFGIFSIFCFVIGLKAGTFATERQRYKFSIIGSVLVILASLMTILLTWLTIPVSLVSYLKFGLPTLAISIAGLATVEHSRKEFKDTIKGQKVWDQKEAESWVF